MAQVKVFLNSERAGQVLRVLAHWFPRFAEECSKVGSSKWGVQLVIKNVRPRHTREQENYYWQSLKMLGKECGYTDAEAEKYLHPVICSAAFGEREVKEIQYQGKTYAWPVPEETSSKDATGDDRDRETYSKLIETLIMVADDMGFHIPPPERQ